MTVAAVASYHAIEKPTRHNPKSVPVILLCLGIAIGVVQLDNKLPRTYDRGTFKQSSGFGLRYDVRPRNECSEEFRAVAIGVNAPHREAPESAIDEGGIIIPGRQSHPRIVVLGDSHATMWSGLIERIVREERITTSIYAIAGADPFFSVPVVPQENPSGLTRPEKFRYDSNRVRYITEWKPRVVVVAIKRLDEKATEAADFLKFLEAQASIVLVIEQPPIVPRVGNRNVAQFLRYRGILPKDDEDTYYGDFKMEELQTRRRRLEGIAGAHKNFVLVPAADLYANGAQVLVARGRNAVYLDDDHLTEFGTSLAYDRMRAVITSTFAASEETPSDATEKTDSTTPEGSE